MGGGSDRDNNNNTIQRDNSIRDIKEDIGDNDDNTREDNRDNGDENKDYNNNGDWKDNRNGKENNIGGNNGGNSVGFNIYNKTLIETTLTIKPRQYLV